MPRKGRAGKIKHWHTEYFSVKNTNHTRIKITPTIESGSLRYFITTADDSAGTNAVTEEITTLNSFVNLSTPNKAIKAELIGSNGAILTNIEFDYNKI